MNLCTLHSQVETQYIYSTLSESGSQIKFRKLTQLMIQVSSRFRSLVYFDDSESIEQIKSVLFALCVKKENFTRNWTVCLSCLTPPRGPSVVTYGISGAIT
ncbi:hypothetical protein CEXT_480611 [Caerostris extrusa]|uniref:Uncharacterized protein n=1 Tax=Caerostris extrusa TaxID=172846 RepID=A0AAV4NGB3_CAEEX|nr:hypothetical protein CEXT_480611 [Caerostris extrusa]